MLEKAELLQRISCCQLSATEVELMLEMLIWIEEQCSFFSSNKRKQTKKIIFDSLDATKF